MDSTVEMYDALDRQDNTDKHDVRRWKWFESEIGVHRRNDGVKYRPLKVDTSDKVSGRKPTITLLQCAHRKLKFWLYGRLATLYGT